MAVSYTFVIQQDSGELSYIASDFHVNSIKHPTDATAVWHARYNETEVNRIFVHTFAYPMPVGCQVSAAEFEIKVKNLGDKYSNDALGFVERGSDLFSIRVWPKEARKGDEQVLTFDLDRLQGNLHNLDVEYDSVLDSLNDGDFSLFVQDDTSVAYVQLTLTVSGEDGSCFIGAGQLPGHMITSKPQNP